MEQLIGWLWSFGNAGAIRNAAALAQRRREDDFAVRSLSRRLRQAHADGTSRAA